MDKKFKKQLIQTALITSPIMAVAMVTPIFIVSGVDFSLYWFALPLASFAIFMNWMVNITIIIKINKQWTKRWVRILLSSAIMITLAYLGFKVAKPQLPITEFRIDLLRSLNIIAVNAIIFVLIDAMFLREKEEKLNQENNDLKVTNIEAKYKLLKDQINPHFLFNALSTAKSLVKRHPDLAEEFIVKLSDFLRVSINNEQRTISLKDELKLVNDYVSLQKIRFGEALNIKYKVDPNFESYFVPYFSILTLVENAVKHNSLTLEAPLFISVYNENDLMVIENNLQTKFVIEESTKTGLKNLNERYKLLTGDELNISSSENKFIVKFKISKP